MISIINLFQQSFYKTVISDGMSGCPRGGEMVKVPDCGILVSEFELQPLY